MITRPAKTRVLLLIISAMVLLNLGLLVSFVWKKEEKNSVQMSRNAGTMNDFLMQGVGFSEAQKKKADSMWAEHRKSIQPYFEDLQKMKVDFFRQVSQKAPGDSGLSEMAAQIGLKQKEIELRFYNHLYKLRELCTEGQINRFDSLFPSVIQKIVSPRRRGNKETSKDSTGK